MITFPRLLLLLWILAEVCLAQSPTPSIEYYWIDENQLCLWKLGDSAGGLIVRKNEGRWIPELTSDWNEALRKIADTKTSGDISQVALDKLSRERPANDWARPRMPDVEIVLRMNKAKDPTAGTITIISRIANTEFNNTVVLNQNGWQRTGITPLGNLLDDPNENEAASKIGGPPPPQAGGWQAYWDQYVKAGIQAPNPILSTYIDVNSKPRSLLRYTLTETAWMARHDAFTCPSVIKTGTSSNVSSSTPGWTGYSLVGLVSFVIGFFSPPAVRKLRRLSQKPAPGQQATAGGPSGDVPGAAKPGASTLTSELTGAGPALHGSEIDHAVDAAWKETRTAFISVVKRSVGQPSVGVSAPQTGASSTPTSSSWEPAVRELYKEAGKIPRDSKLHLLDPARLGVKEWVERLPERIQALIESVDRLEKENQAAARELDTHASLAARHQRDLTQIKNERDLLRVEFNTLQNKSISLDNELQKSATDLKEAIERIQQFEVDLKKRSDEIQSLTKDREDLKANLEATQKQVKENETAGNRLRELKEDFRRIEGVAKRLQDGHQQFYSAKGDISTTAMISFLANHSLYKLAVASVTENVPLRQNMLINLTRLATALQEYRGFGLTMKTLHADFPDPVQPDVVRSASDRLDGSIFQFTLGYLSNSHRIKLAPFYLDVDDQGKPYRAD